MRSRTLPDSLPARVYLLAYDVQRQRLTGDQLALTVRGALLAELSMRDCLTEDEDGKVRASGTLRTGDAVLDGVLPAISESRPRPWRWWLRRDQQQTVCAVRQQLASAGVISVESDRVLGIFPRVRVTASDPATVQAMHDSLRAAVAGSAPVSTADAAAVALAAVGEMSSVLSRKDRKLYAERIKELTEQANAAIPVLSRVLRAVKAARAAARNAGS